MTLKQCTVWAGSSVLPHRASAVVPSVTLPEVQALLTAAFLACMPWHMSLVLLSLGINGPKQLLV